MPSKKKKYNSRFPPARIKKIMQSDEDVGKVAQVVPIIISKALEIFVASLLRSASDVTRSRNARTLTPAHIKLSIFSDNQFQFLRDLAQTIPDVNANGDEEEDASGGNSTPGALQMAAPRLQRKTSQNKLSTTTTAATGKTRGRPRKRPMESQTSISSQKDAIEEHEQEDEEEDDEDEETDEDEPDDDNDAHHFSRGESKNSVIFYAPQQPQQPSQPSNLSSVLNPCSSSSQSSTPQSALNFRAKLTHLDEDDDYDN